VIGPAIIPIQRENLENRPLPLKETMNNPIRINRIKGKGGENEGGEKGEKASSGKKGGVSNSMQLRKNGSDRGEPIKT